MSEAGAPPPNPEATQPGAEDQTQQQDTADPWTETLNGVDEVYRPHLEQSINSLRETFSPRLEIADRMEPLGDYADDLLALHGMADDDGNALEDFLGFASMASQVDPENPDSEANKAFAQWFYEIGDRLGLLDPDGDEDGEDGDLDDDSEGDEPDEVSELRELVSGLQARIQEFETNGRVSSVQQEIATTLDSQVKQHNLTGKDDAETEKTKNRILTLARAYEDRNDISTPQMIELAVKDFLELTGQAQQGLLGGAETEQVPAGRSPGNGSPDLHPDELTTGDPTLTRRRVKEAAMSRLRS